MNENIVQTSTLKSFELVHHTANLVHWGIIILEQLVHPCTKLPTKFQKSNQNHPQNLDHQCLPSQLK